MSDKEAMQKQEKRTPAQYLQRIQVLHSYSPTIASDRSAHAKERCFILSSYCLFLRSKIDCFVCKWIQTFMGLIPIMNAQKGCKKKLADWMLLAFSKFSLHRTEENCDCGILGHNDVILSVTSTYTVKLWIWFERFKDVLWHDNNIYSITLVFPDRYLWAIPTKVLVAKMEWVLE